MPDSDRFNPDWFSPPGDTVADILKKKRISPDEFANRIGRTRDYVLRLIRGETTINEEVSKLLSILGPSESFWINRERQYRLSLAQREIEIDAKARSLFLSSMPLNDMKRYGWLETSARNWSDVVQCLRFFGVPTIEAWNSAVNKLLNEATLRTSRTFKSDPGAMAAWIRQGELKASNMDCNKWDPEKFRIALRNIRSLTRKDDPAVFLPQLQKQCSSCGVAVVVLRAPKMCKASGACRTLSNGVRLILLSARYLSDDHFWFTFFHEAAHLLLHGERPIYVDVPEDEETPASNDESEANEFAADILIPPSHRAELQALPIDGRRVMRFARNIGIAPGVVVGQMQHLGILSNKQLNNLKKRFRWGE
jgi:HTH-type transcriptional regulator / antitoxin HigA